MVVTDQTGAGLSGASIVAKGASTQSGLTDATGCVLFAGLIPGSYAIGITDAGYVDPNGNPASPLTVNTSVTSTGTAATNVHLGLGGSFTGTFVAATGLSSPTSVSGQADGISWTGTGGSYGMSAPQDNTASSPQPSLATDTLFPFSGTNGYVGNYTIWGGRCPQQQPPAGTDAFSVNPGATLGQNVTEPALKLAFTFGGSSIQPLHVRLAFTSLSGTSCYDWSPTIRSDDRRQHRLAEVAGTTVRRRYYRKPVGLRRLQSGTRTYTKTVTTTNTNFAGMTNVSDCPHDQQHPGNMPDLVTRLRARVRSEDGFTLVGTGGVDGGRGGGAHRVDDDHGGDAASVAATRSPRWTRPVRRAPRWARSRTSFTPRA